MQGLGETTSLPCVILALEERSQSSLVATAREACIARDASIVLEG